MLEPWAMRHKRLKKEVAWRLYQRGDLRTVSWLHATSEAEASNLARHDIGRPVTLIPNGVDLPPRVTDGSSRSGDEIRTAVFLGRIYPVKGLPMLVEAWNRVRPENWRLILAGPDEAGHLSEVTKLAAARGLEMEISFPGSVEGDAKESFFRNADLFVLPTHSESFGMAVAEALSYGLPVLTTTAAPWPWLEQTGCGWRVAPDVASLAAGLATATSMDRSTLAGMGQRGRELVAEQFRWSAIATRFIAAYESAS
jgi:glycosyltransferase involved in cell wall biosynthesis